MYDDWTDWIELMFMSGSLGVPDFRLQRCLVAVVPHCIPEPASVCSHLVGCRVYGFITPGQTEETGLQPERRYLSAAAAAAARGPAGALSRAGQSEWEDGLRSY